MRRAASFGLPGLKAAGESHAVRGPKRHRREPMRIAAVGPQRKVYQAVERVRVGSAPAEDGTGALDDEADLLGKVHGSGVQVNGVSRRAERRHLPG
jgi:hypothetical protein